MVAKNDVTGDNIATKYNSSNYVNNFDMIDWGKKKEEKKEEKVVDDDGKEE